MMIQKVSISTMKKFKNKCFNVDLCLYPKLLCTYISKWIISNITCHRITAFPNNMNTKYFEQERLLVFISFHQKKKFLLHDWDHKSVVFGNCYAQLANFERILHSIKNVCCCSMFNYVFKSHRKRITQWFARTLFFRFLFNVGS